MVYTHLPRLPLSSSSSFSTVVRLSLSLFPPSLCCCYFFDLKISDEQNALLLSFLFIFPPLSLRLDCNFSILVASSFFSFLVLWILFHLCVWDSRRLRSAPLPHSKSQQPEWTPRCAFVLFAPVVLSVKTTYNELEVTTGPNFPFFFLSPQLLFVELTAIGSAGASCSCRFQSPRFLSLADKSFFFCFKSMKKSPKVSVATHWQQSS